MSVHAAESNVLDRSGVGLLTTYRRNGEAVATPVSIAVQVGGIYFVSSTTSGKARRLKARADVTLAPATVAGRPTGPASSGQAHVLDEAARRRVRRLLQPGGPLFWSYLTYRIRGHQMDVYEVRLAEQCHPGSANGADASEKTAPLYRAVHRTARVSALLFAAAQATSARGTKAGPASRRLYLAFMAAHAVHFTVVARYAKVNRGRDLFPGGRSMHEVGGWPTVLRIYGFFASLALLGWVAGPPRATGRHPVSVLGNGATGLIGAMFVGTYLGQLPRSPWYAVPATTVAGAVTANFLAQRRRPQLPRTDLGGLPLGRLRLESMKMVRLRNVPLPEAVLLGLGLGAVLHRLRPLSLPGPRSIHRIAGVILVASGMSLVVGAVRAAGSVAIDNPDRLLTKGPYALTRNPMYLGWGLLHLGSALVADSGWLLAAVPPAACAVHHGVLSDERWLEQRFGEEFERYRATVPRYLPSRG